MIPLNRTCGHSTSAWCQLGNGLRIVNGGSGQWKRLRSRMGMLLMMMNATTKFTYIQQSHYILTMVQTMNKLSTLQNKSRHISNANLFTQMTLSCWQYRQPNQCWQYRHIREYRHSMSNVHSCTRIHRISQYSQDTANNSLKYSTQHTVNICNIIIGKYR